MKDYEGWKKDPSIPLPQVVSGFKVFTAHKYVNSPTSRSLLVIPVDKIPGEARKAHWIRRQSLCYRVSLARQTRTRSLRRSSGKDTRRSRRYSSRSYQLVVGANRFTCRTPNARATPTRATEARSPRIRRCCCNVNVNVNVNININLFFLPHRVQLTIYPALWDGMGWRICINEVVPCSAGPSLGACVVLVPGDVTGR